jgi:hypothetical protein
MLAQPAVIAVYVDGASANFGDCDLTACDAKGAVAGTVPSITPAPVGKTGARATTLALRCR